MSELADEDWLSCGFVVEKPPVTECAAASRRNPYATRYSLTNSARFSVWTDGVIG